MTTETDKSARIAVMDSGLGGLTVFSEINKLLPQADLLYFADDAAFPYGRLTEAELVERVMTLTTRIIERHAPDMVVLACNTASTLSLPHLRAAFTVPFVGTVPAIKPAVAASKTRHISILATPGTVARDYTKSLVAEHAADCYVNLIGCERLAEYAEAELHGAAVSDDAIRTAIAPAFRDDTDTIVLACTHYPLLLERFRALAPREVQWINPAPAIARRVASLLPEASGNGTRHIFFTDGGNSTPTLRNALSAYGFSKSETETLPFLPPSGTTPAS